jgi:hypothetical protein
MRRTTVAESGFYIAVRERNTFRRANGRGLRQGKPAGLGDLNNTNTALKEPVVPVSAKQEAESP